MVKILNKSKTVLLNIIFLLFNCLLVTNLFSRDLEKSSTFPDYARNGVTLKPIISEAGFTLSTNNKIKFAKCDTLICHLMIKKSSVKKNEYVELTQNFLNNLKRSWKTSGEKHDFLRDSLVLVDDKDQNSAILDIVKVAVAIESSNQAWAEKIILDLLGLEHHHSFFNSYIAKGDLEKLQKNVMGILQHTQRKMQDKFLFKLFASYLVEFYDVSSRKEFYKAFNLNWTLQEIRKVAESKVYGHNLTGLWIPILKKRVSRSELVKYYKKVLTEENIIRFPKKVLWIIMDYVPDNKTIKQKIVKVISSMRNSVDPYLKELYIRLHDKDKVSEMFVKSLHKRPVFVLKRDFYRDLLKKNIAVEYAVYNLLMLGDLSY